MDLNSGNSESKIKTQEIGIAMGPKSDFAQWPKAMTLNLRCTLEIPGELKNTIILIQFYQNLWEWISGIRISKDSPGNPNSQSSLRTDVFRSFPEQRSKTNILKTSKRMYMYN